MTMFRNRKLWFSAATALVLLSAVAGWQVLSAPAEPEIPTLNQLLSVPDAALSVSLYSHDGAPASDLDVPNADRSVDVRVGGVLRSRFITRDDGTTRDIFFQEDGLRQAYVKDFYARQPHELGRRQRSIIYYGGDGTTVGSGEWNRLDGTAEKIQYALGGGYFQVFMLAADGQTAEAGMIYAPDQFANNFEPKLVEEDRWGPVSKGHVLTFKDVLEDDGTRTQTAFDDGGHLLMEKHIGRWGIAGTTVKFYWPGTNKVRIDSKSEYGATNASYYRIDGTLSLLVKLTYNALEVSHYDASGQTELFWQSFWSRSVLKDGKPVPGWEPYQVIVKDGKGATVRELSYDQGQLRQDDRPHFTAGGIAYERVQFWYRPDGTLEKVDYSGASNEKQFSVKAVAHTAGEDIRADVPPVYLAPPTVPEELPVPPPERLER